MRLDVKPVYANVLALAEIAWYEYAIRFLFGGLVTALAGMIAKKYGPGIGGLFLAFPAIFPASATLIEKHERKRKAEKGLAGICRARQAVSADAAGAVMGCVGLIAFAGIVWQWVADLSPILVITAATFAWAIVSGLVWVAWKRNWLPHRALARFFRQQHNSV